MNEARADYDQNSLSYYVGATLATPVTGLRCGASFDYLSVHHLKGETWSFAGYASYQATDKLSLHLRGEYLRDRGSQKFFVADVIDPTDGDVVGATKTNPDRVLALTAMATGSMCVQEGVGCGTQEVKLSGITYSACRV